MAVAVAAVLGVRRAEAQPRDRFALRLEGGAGTVLSDFQRGDVKGFDVASHVALRLAWYPANSVALQASASGWIFPTDAAHPWGLVVAPMVGIRFEPRAGSVGRFFFDGNLGVAFTGDDRTLQVDAGAGFEFALGSVVSLGPMARYGQTVQPDRDGNGLPQRFPDDARYVVGGLSLSFLATSSSAASVADADGDGVPDDADRCPQRPAGLHADPQRAGCPDPDRDGDGLADRDDLCPEVPAGDRPDPRRAGCPARDRDNDGVDDADDLCVTVPLGPHPDPQRPGCPDGDRDGDGITDHADRCPDAAAPGTTDGCAAEPTPLPAPTVTPAAAVAVVPAPAPAPVSPRTVVPPAATTTTMPSVAATATTLAVRDGRIELPGTGVSFATGSDRIVGRRSFETLDALAATLAAHPEIARVEVQGHTDDRGDRAVNVALSAARAEAVRAYVLAHGVAEPRVVAVGHGPDHPCADNATVEGRAANRRVEVHVRAAR